MQTFHWLAEYGFARHALVTGVAIGVVCSLLSVVVVLKRMAFIGQGISHAGFGGVGTATLLGISGGWAQDAVIALFCLGSAVLIGVLSRRRRIEADTAIGILLVAAMAWGVLMTDLSMSLRRYGWYTEWFGPFAQRTGVEQLLFGSLLSVELGDAVAAVALAVVVAAVLALLFKELVFYSFDERVSQVFGVPARALYYLLLVLLSATVVLSIRLVGFVLVSALLVIPGATAVLLSQRLGTVLVLSVGVGLLGTVGGLVLSLEAGNLSSGPCIVAVLCVAFGLAFAARGLGRLGSGGGAGA